MRVVLAFVTAFVPVAMLPSVASHQDGVGLLIRGGEVYDGNGGAPRPADVRTAGDVIVAVAQGLEPREGERTNLPKTASGRSSDGRLLFYDSINPQTVGEIWVLPLAGTPEPYPVVRTTADEHYGTLSPDGRWLAYISNETGAYEVYVESFPATGFKRQVSAQGGFEPHWRRDGRELFYMAPNQTLMAVGVKNNPTTLEVSPPEALFATRIKWMEIQAVAHHYAPAPNGQRFLVSSATDEARSVPVTIVLNWSAALKK